MGTVHKIRPTEEIQDRGGSKTDTWEGILDRFRGWFQGLTPDQQVELRAITRPDRSDWDQELYRFEAWFDRLSKQRQDQVRGLLDAPKDLAEIDRQAIALLELLNDRRATVLPSARGFALVPANTKLARLRPAGML